MACAIANIYNQIFEQKNSVKMRAQGFYMSQQLTGFKPAKFCMLLDITRHPPVKT
jgi:hypothetical protein